MNAKLKRMVVSAAAVTLFGAGTLAVAPAAQAQPGPWCSVNPVAATAAYSQCAGLVHHQVRITCWAWWSWFSSYERWGNPAVGAQQSWSSCDLPFTLQTWQVVTF
ncbi:hypothetical protein [Nocardia sp. CC227C]|uniref:hypothetical protein n=1 Tax=Nocardia sp. CC227C TaxID=3044562 RepID=UPI00278C110D|nr:hypothetical protein [Nocardia sp. CC227C]